LFSLSKGLLGGVIPQKSIPTSEELLPEAG